MVRLLVRKREAAEMLGVSLRMVDRLLAEGKLTAVRPGGATKATRVEMAELLRFVETSRSQTSTE